MKIIKYSSHELYNTWNMMKRRCYDKNHTNYKNYGALGIEVCPRWRFSSKNFIEDVIELIGERPEGCSLDRVNPYDDYHPYNIRWANRTTQNLNKKQKNPTGENYIHLTTNKKWYSVSIQVGDIRRTSSIFRDLGEAKKLRDDWLQELEIDKEEWVNNTLNKNFKKTTLKEFLDIPDKKYININKNGSISVEISRDKIRRRGTVKNLTDALTLRNLWLIELYNNPEKWKEDTINKTFNRRV